MMKTDLVSNLPSGMQERVNNTGSDMEKWLAERKERAKYIKDLSLRLFMKKIKEYAVSEQLCKKIRKLDQKHLAWKRELKRSSL